MLPVPGDDDAEAIDAALDTRIPNVSRVYNRWLGGQDNFSADRTAADTLSADFPEIAHVARANRLFVLRAVRHVAVVPGDMRQPQQILGHPDLHAVLDPDRPVCVLLAAVLHFVIPAEADAAVAAFTAAMTPGSYLILSSGTTTGTSPMIVASLSATFQGHTTVTGRTTTEIAGYFAGLDLEPPGLVDVWAWRPDREENWPPAPALRILGGVARKPLSHRACGPQ